MSVPDSHSLCNNDNRSAAHVGWERSAPHRGLGMNRWILHERQSEIEGACGTPMCDRMYVQTSDFVISFAKAL